MSDQNAVGAFEELGLTRVEAEVYIYLIQNSPATGYAISAAINRTRGAIYKVLGSLTEKGAVMVDEGQSSQVRAVPCAEFLANLDRQFTRRKQVADEAASLLKSSPSDQRVYRLTNTRQVYERARQMLDEARERVLLEISPRTLAVLREPLEGTAARGIQMTTRVYEPTELAGVNLINSPFGENLAADWDAQWLALFVDGFQVLFGQFTADGSAVTQALWSQSPFLSRAIYGYVNSDLHHYAFRACLESAATLEEVREEYARLEGVFPVGGDLGWKQQLQKNAPPES